MRFRGSGTLEVQLAQHVTLGPVAIDNLTLGIGIKGNAFPISITADLGTSLGPLTAVVLGIGFEVAVTLTPDNKGNLGPVDIQPSFRAPKGIGLSLDVGGFKGGGFLKLDPELGEYAGGLELDFLGIVTVKAFGLLNTKFPDGHRGFSLVIIISAEFPPIQLGFGFTLVGVGGLLGLSRTVDTDAMREGIHQGALDSVLFPRNIVANAPRIVNDLRRLFPPQEGHFVVGPMVKLGWGTPTILSLEFGLILEIPIAGFIMIGRLRAGLPFQDLPLFDIRVTFAGGVDFEAGQLWFDATLYGSRLLTFSLTGDMAVRLYWKENANLILTVGGFHPAYTPPPLGLGTLQRLGITIFDGQPRLRAETYFAITSNTVQFGAKAELMYGIDIFKRGDEAERVELDQDVEGDEAKYIHVPASYASPMAGLLVDEWTELVPSLDETTGIAMHINRPNAVAPQALLVAVAPKQTGRWAWSDLIAILNDTMDRARLRAVEPDDIKNPYFQLLPPIVTAFDDSMLMAAAKFSGVAAALKT